MDLTDEDVKKFYQLFMRYDKPSSNIGIVGNKRKFDLYIKEVLERFKGTKARIIRNENKVIILLNDIEYTYIHIRNIHDMRGYTFKKFI